jgi:hypothetical protein
MRRIAAALLATLILIGPMTMEATGQPQPHLGRWRGPCSTWQYGEHLTPAKFNADPDRARGQIRRLITCVFDHYAPGNADTALYVADRESSLYPWAQNPSSLCSGLFQHILSAWASRASYYLDRWMFGEGSWPARWSDPRANAIVAARMVAAGGWGPWGG